VRKASLACICLGVCLDAGWLAAAVPGELYSVTAHIGSRCYSAPLLLSDIEEQNAKDPASKTGWGFAEARAIAKSAAEASSYKASIVRLHSVEFDNWPLLKTPICIVRFSAKIDGAEGLLAFIVLPDGRVVLPEPCRT
jgi:hypothetical protein